MNGELTKKILLHFIRVVCCLPRSKEPKEEVEKLLAAKIK
jgi:hypothetical protein